MCPPYPKRVVKGDSFDTREISLDTGEKLTNPDVVRILYYYYVPINEWLNGEFDK